MSEPVRIAVVGAGFMGGMHARVLAQTPAARLTHIVDVRAEAAEALAAELGAAATSDLAAVLADPGLEAVVVATPDRLHVEVAVQALAAGKAVLLEKPMAHDAAGACAIHAAATRGTGRLMVGHIVRFDPRYRHAAALAGAGELGDPLHVTASRFCQHPGRRAVGSHLCFLMGVHDVDVVQWLTGRAVRRVFAVAARDCIPELRVGVDDVIMATLELEGGVLGQLSFGWTLPQNTHAPLQAGVRLVGTRGMIEIADTDTGIVAVTPGSVGVLDTRFWPMLDGRIGGALRAEVDHFLEATRAGTPYLVPIDAALAAVQVNDAIMRSLESGRFEAI